MLGHSFGKEVENWNRIEQEKGLNPEKKKARWEQIIEIEQEVSWREKSTLYG